MSLDTDKLCLSGSITATAGELAAAIELETGDNPATRKRKGEIMSDFASNGIMRHRRLAATSWFVLAAAATAAAALAVPRYRRNHRSI